MIRARGDEVAVHGPVVVLAEGEAVGGVVVVFADLEKPIGEAVTQILAPWDAVWRGFSFINEIERGEKQQRFVRSLVRRTLFDRCDAGMEVVEAFAMSQG
jgi:hypothetical protein